MKELFNKYKLTMILIFIGMIVGGLIIELFNYFGVIRLSSKNIASYKGGKVTVNDLYKELRSQGGIDALLNLVDGELAKSYGNEEEAVEYARTTANKYFKLYETNYGYSKEEFLNANGFKNEDSFIDYLKKDYFLNKYYENYLRSLISDEEAKNYYDTSVFGDKLNVYIVSSKTKNDLNKIYNSFKNNKDITKLKDTKTVTVNNIDVLGFDEASNYSEQFVKILKNTKSNEVSKIFKDDIYGYVFIYVLTSTEKDTFETYKDRIKDVLGNELTNKDNTLYYKALIQLRNDSNFKINDYELNKEYEEFKKQYE